jgi:hypothetical protein
MHCASMKHGRGNLADRRGRLESLEPTQGSSRYCGIANGVAGAFEFLSVLVATPALTGGLNSLRKRLK